MPGGGECLEIEVLEDVDAVRHEQVHVAEERLEVEDLRTGHVFEQRHLHTSPRHRSAKAFARRTELPTDRGSVRSRFAA
jgi:hypothetical protein